MISRKKVLMVTLGMFICAICVGLYVFVAGVSQKTFGGFVRYVAIVFCFLEFFALLVVVWIPERKMKEESQIREIAKKNLNAYLEHGDGIDPTPRM